MGKQISIYLNEIETRHLFELATRKCRRPNDQARFFILNGLGLVTDDGPNCEMNNRHDAKVSEATSVTAVAA